MVDFDKPRFSSEHAAIHGAAPTWRLIAEQGRWNAAVVVFQTLAFAVPALSPLLKARWDATTLVPLGITVVLLGIYLPKLWRPLVLMIAQGKLYCPGTHPCHCDVSNVGRVFFDGRAVRLIFRDLNALIADAPDPQAQKELQAAIRDSWEQTGTHVSFLGFRITQADELRAALHLPNAGYHDAAEEHETFIRQLVSQTPVVWVTPLILVLNVAIFGLMLQASVPLFSPTALEVLPWGANFGPATFNGEWWRLFTCMFLHFGLIHIACNMIALQDGGAMLERLTGNVGFALLYLLSGFGGSLASLLWSPDNVSAGASGAVFGVFGALVVWFYVRRRQFPANIFTSMMRGIVPFIGFNLLVGARSTGIDQAAHIGGLVTGCVCGLLLSRPLTGNPFLPRLWRNLVLALLGGAVIFYSVRHLPKAEDAQGFFGEETRFQQLDEMLHALYESKRQEFLHGNITASEYERVLRQDILPPWEQARDHLATQKFANPNQQAIIARLVRYATLHAEGWREQADGIAKNDQELYRRGLEKHDAADATFHGS